MHPNPAFRHTACDQNLAFARATPPAPALIAISGPEADISPEWYGPHDQVPDQVPTWNYVAVHLRGTLEALPQDALRPHVDALSAEYERRIADKRPWTSAKMTEGAMPRMMRMILPFRFHVASVEGTGKLNRNKTPDIRARTAEALSRGSPSAQEIAALIRRDLG